MGQCLICILYLISVIIAQSSVSGEKTSRNHRSPDGNLPKTSKELNQVKSDTLICEVDLKRSHNQCKIRQEELDDRRDLLRTVLANGLTLTSEKVAKAEEFNVQIKEATEISKNYQEKVDQLRHENNWLKCRREYAPQAQKWLLDALNKALSSMTQSASANLPQNIGVDSCSGELARVEEKLRASLQREATLESELLALRRNISRNNFDDLRHSNSHNLKPAFNSSSECDANTALTATNFQGLLSAVIGPNPSNNNGYVLVNGSPINSAQLLGPTFVRSLKFVNTSVVLSQVPYFLSNVPNLVSLELTNVSFVSKLKEEIAHLPMLRQLTINVNTGIDSSSSWDGVVNYVDQFNLGYFPFILEDWCRVHTSISVSGIQIFKWNPAEKELISTTKYTNKALFTKPGNCTVEKLYILEHAVKPTLIPDTLTTLAIFNSTFDKNLEHILKKSTRLTHLTIISKYRRSNADLQVGLLPPTLKSLALRRVNVNYSFGTPLLNLESFTIFGCYFDNATVTHFRNVFNAKYVAINDQHSQDDFPITYSLLDQLLKMSSVQKIYIRAFDRADLWSSWSPKVTVVEKLLSNISRTVTDYVLQKTTAGGWVNTGDGLSSSFDAFNMFKLNKFAVLQAYEDMLYGSLALSI